MINCLRNLGYEVNFIQVDEGGELARSAIFTQFVCNNDCIMETTGGGNSSNNGMVERGNRTKADMITSQLSTMKVLMGSDLPKGFEVQKFWCFAYQYSSFILRRMYNRLRGDIPYYLVHKERPSARELVPLGAIMTIIDPHKNNLPKLSRDRAKTGYFLGYSNHSKIRLYWSKDSPTMIKRSAHCVIEDVQTMKLLEPGFIETSNPVSTSTVIETTSSIHLILIVYQLHLPKRASIQLLSNCPNTHKV